jgi:hypothetical protein
VASTKPHAASCFLGSRVPLRIHPRPCQRGCGGARSNLVGCILCLQRGVAHTSCARQFAGRGWAILHGASVGARSNAQVRTGRFLFAQPLSTSMLCGSDAPRAWMKRTGPWPAQVQSCDGGIKAAASCSSLRPSNITTMHTFVPGLLQVTPGQPCRCRCGSAGHLSYRSHGSGCWVPCSFHIGYATRLIACMLSNIRTGVGRKPTSSRGDHSLTAGLCCTAAVVARAPASIC